MFFRLSWDNQGSIDLFGSEKPHLCLEDVVRSASGYAVVKNPGGLCAARLRVSEKNFVADHAQSLGDV